MHACHTNIVLCEVAGQHREANQTDREASRTGRLHSRCSAEHILLTHARVPGRRLICSIPSHQPRSRDSKALCLHEEKSSVGCLKE